MPVESDQDRAAFFSTDEFAVEGIYTPRGQTAVSVPGLLNRPHLEVDLGAVSVSDAQTTFHCRSADLPATAAGDAGDTIAIAAETFQVLTIQPDGSGMSLLRLGKQG